MMNFKDINTNTHDSNFDSVESLITNVFPSLVEKPVSMITLNDMEDAARSQQWNLSTDQGFLLYLKSFSERIIEKTRKTEREMDGLLDSITSMEAKMGTANSYLDILGINQFVEQRIEPKDTSSIKKGNTKKQISQQEALSSIVLPSFKNSYDIAAEVFEIFYQKSPKPHPLSVAQFEPNIAAPKAPTDSVFNSKIDVMSKLPSGKSTLPPNPSEIQSSVSTEPIDPISVPEEKEPQPIFNEEISKKSLLFDDTIQRVEIESIISQSTQSTNIPSLFSDDSSIISNKKKNEKSNIFGSIFDDEKPKKTKKNSIKSIFGDEFEDQLISRNETENLSKVSIFGSVDHKEDKKTTSLLSNSIQNDSDSISDGLFAPIVKSRKIDNRVIKKDTLVNCAIDEGNQNLKLNSQKSPKTTKTKKGKHTVSLFGEIPEFLTNGETKQAIFEEKTILTKKEQTKKSIFEEEPIQIKKPKSEETKKSLFEEEPLQIKKEETKKPKSEESKKNIFEEEPIEIKKEETKKSIFEEEPIDIKKEETKKPKSEETKKNIFEEEPLQIKKEETKKPKSEESKKNIFEEEPIEIKKEETKKSIFEEEPLQIKKEETKKSIFEEDPLQIKKEETKKSIFEEEPLQIKKEETKKPKSEETKKSIFEEDPLQIKKEETKKSIFEEQPIEIKKEETKKSIFEEEPLQIKKEETKKPKSEETKKSIFEEQPIEIKKEETKKSIFEVEPIEIQNVDINEVLIAEHMLDKQEIKETIGNKSSVSLNQHSTSRPSKESRNSKNSRRKSNSEQFLSNTEDPLLALLGNKESRTKTILIDTLEELIVSEKEIVPLSPGFLFDEDVEKIKKEEKQKEKERKEKEEREMIEELERKRQREIEEEKRREIERLAEQERKMKEQIAEEELKKKPIKKKTTKKSRMLDIDDDPILSISPKINKVETNQIEVDDDLPIPIAGQTVPDPKPKTIQPKKNTKQVVSQPGGVNQNFDGFTAKIQPTIVQPKKFTGKSMFDDD